MGEIKKMAVIVPFYKDEITAFEDVALKQCCNVLSAYPIIIIKPKSLNLPEAITQKASRIISFADQYFADRQGYNQLMLDHQFYYVFLSYDYILIYQLDAFVFKDELDYWCNKGFDFIGAPWMRKKDYSHIVIAWLAKGLQYLARRYDFKKNGPPSKKQFDDRVGNGGFSLRRTKAFHEICIKSHLKIAEYNKQTDSHYNEDAFWSIEVNRKKKVLNIPDYKTALRFAFELAPERSLRINNNELPFGCHAWDKHMVFWRPFFKEQGYEI